MYRQTDTWLVILEYERFLQPIAVPRSHAVSVVRMLPGSVAMNVLLPALVSLVLLWVTCSPEVLPNSQTA